MAQLPVGDVCTDDLYLAGERAPAGVYRQIGSGREIRLNNMDFLPASLDGRVACYLRINAPQSIAQVPVNP